jgi:Swi5
MMELDSSSESMSQPSPASTGITVTQSSNTTTDKASNKDISEAEEPENVDANEKTISALPHTTKSTAIKNSISRSSQLQTTLQDLENQRRDLLRQLQTELKSSPPLLSTQSIAYLPSTHAHSQPVSPLTALTEAELLGQAKSTIKDHIKSLHGYNQVRDVGTGLIGMVAESRKVRVRDCQEEFGVTDGD